MAEKAIDLFNQIENPDEIVVILLFNACAQLGTKEALAVVKKVAQEMPKSFHSTSLYFNISTGCIDEMWRC